ncbi:nuclear transport factor 2 family protein [Ampullimonas aquatilis]|uniref:nuclear transport factor 2 family protein n=1 Tax=Ampullimonas aquatilis TaxID=1341549 RepID=UPI003C7152D9
MSSIDHHNSLANIRHFFEHLSLDSLAMIDTVYTKDAYFKDPFNEVRGIEPVTRIFRHMFEQVDIPNFVVTHTLLQDDHAFLTWQFSFRMRRWHSDTQQIIGASHVRFADDGRVVYHRDYWDAAEQLYEKVPVLGSAMRWLKRAAQK